MENENENESVKAEDVGEEGPAQQKNHGFASHNSGLWNQDELISSAQDEDFKEDLPPSNNGTEERSE
jgi:hypothetical protein